MGVDVLVGAQLRRLEAGVEGVRDVRLAAPDAEIGGRGATARRHGDRSNPTGRPATGPGSERAGGTWETPYGTGVTAGYIS